jgi:hypothetical protein
MTSYGTILTRRDMMAGRTNFGYFSRQKSPRCSLGGGDLSTLCKKRDHGALPPSSEIMPKHDEYLGGIGKKYIGG